LELTDVPTTGLAALHQLIVSVRRQHAALVATNAPVKHVILFQTGRPVRLVSMYVLTTGPVVLLQRIVQLEKQRAVLVVMNARHAQVIL